MRWRMIEIDIPDHLVVSVHIAQLPLDWAAQPAPDSAKKFGEKWIKAGTSLGLRVPSAVIPDEFNVILNPTLPELVKVQVVDIKDFQFDQRL